MRIAFGVDELGVDADLVARSPDASFQHIAHTELAADLPRVHSLIAISECCRARNHDHTYDP
jgi:hypothetical protein